MSLLVASSAFYDRQVDIDPPSLKYSYILHAKFGVGKSDIIINRCVLKSWLEYVYLQSVSLKNSRPTILYYISYIVFEWQVKFAYLWTGERVFFLWMTEQVFTHWKVSTYFYLLLLFILDVFTHAYNIINKVELQNPISNQEKWLQFNRELPTEMIEGGREVVELVSVDIIKLIIHKVQIRNKHHIFYIHLYDVQTPHSQQNIQSGWQRIDYTLDREFLG